MSDLTDFLLARITEDEGDARSLGGELRGVAWQDGAGTPDRVLAECAAKRRIVEHPPYRRDEGADSDSAYGEWEGILRALAAIYADHPSYRAEWSL